MFKVKATFVVLLFAYSSLSFSNCRKSLKLGELNLKYAMEYLSEGASEAKSAQRKGKNHEDYCSDLESSLRSFNSSFSDVEESRDYFMTAKRDCSGNRYKAAKIQLKSMKEYRSSLQSMIREVCTFLAKDCSEVCEPSDLAQYWHDDN